MRDDQFNAFHNTFNNHFDKTTKRVARWAIVSTVASLVLSLTVLGFIGWVIVMFMRHFGVI